MPIGFDDTIESDHLNMLTSKEFGVSCLNTRTGETFDIIKTDAFISVTEQGLPISEDKPMFNTSKKMIDQTGNVIDTDILQDDVLTILGANFRVNDVRNDGIGGFDIYLKDQ